MPLRIKINNFQTVEAKRILKTCDSCHCEPVKIELVKNNSITIGKTTDEGIICNHCYAKKFKTYCNVFRIKMHQNCVIEIFIYHGFIPRLNQKSFYVDVHFENVMHTFYFDDYLCEVFSFETFTKIIEKQIKEMRSSSKKKAVFSSKEFQSQFYGKIMYVFDYMGFCVERDGL